MIKLLHGDCLKHMAELEAESVDLTVTSPPYDNLRTYNGNNEQWGEHVWKAVIADLLRVTKQGGVVVWVVADATINGSETGTSFRQALWAMECGFRLHDTMIFHRKSKPLTHNRYEQEFEYMFVCSKGKPQTVNHIKEPTLASYKDKRTGSNRHRNTDGRFDSRGGDWNRLPYKIKGNVWRFIVGSSMADKIAFQHPAIFPLQLANDHIISWSNEGDTVLDCFMGSGTTGVACVKTGRSFIGIELDKGYFELANKRIWQAKQSRGLLNYMEVISD